MGAMGMGREVAYGACILSPSGVIVCTDPSDSSSGGGEGMYLMMLLRRNRVLSSVEGGPHTEEAGSDEAI